MQRKLQQVREGRMLKQNKINKYKVAGEGGGSGREMCILGNIAAETKIFHIGSRDIRQ